ncbi:BCD family MFS transporter [Candidatus Viridilinea mediisalina]|nr:BCD family MFS transporter [Candidatus Viridilinea mediisalina]
MMGVLRLVILTLRLAISRFGAGWMFALLTFNFNRVAIADIHPGAIAIVVTSLLGLHQFISFTQVYWGRLADRNPIWGYRRTPYIILSSLGASLVFLFLPYIAIGLGQREAFAMVEAYALIIFFGLMMAMNGSSSNSLIAEVTDEKTRGMVVSVVWAMIILSGIISAGVSRVIMPVYTHEAMVQLYNLTPWVVMITTLIGILGIERRVTKEEHARLLAAQPKENDSPLGTFRVARSLMRTNRQVRGFALFVLLAIMGIFLQDAILEPFGAQVFGKPQAETAAYQQYWGAGALLSMLTIGIISSIFPIAKKTIATIGSFAIAGSLAVISVAGFTYQPELMNPALFVMGLGIGFFNVGALSMMMEMTVEGQTGLYMGIWGMAQGLGNGFANIFSGGLVTGLIQTNLLSASVGYSLIFAFEAVVMVMAIGILRGISVQEFKGLSQNDIGTVLAMETAN